jgi:hypothetical protein
MILPRPSASPLHSFASTPVIRRSPKFSETVGAVMGWLTGRRRQSLKHRFREQREIERLAELDLDLDSETESSAGDKSGREDLYSARPTVAPPRKWRAW